MYLGVSGCRLSIQAFQILGLLVSTLMLARARWE